MLRLISIDNATPAMRRLMLGFVLATLYVSPSFAQNVVIVVIDGLRYSESFGAQDTYIPRIWNTLRPQGLLWSNFRNEGVTSTNPGHASIESGTWQTIPNDGTQRPTFPTIFEYFRKQTAFPEQSCAVIVGKSKLDILSHSTHPDYGSAYGATTHIAANDLAVMDSVRSVLTFDKPRLVVINFPDVDVTGHSGNFPSYLSAITRADSLTADLWDFLDSDPFYSETTTMLVTNDHGRHDDANGGFQNHGDSCEGCRHIILLAIGRLIPHDRVTSTLRSQIDIAPTAASLLGFSTPLAAGSNLLADTVTAVPTADTDPVSPVLQLFPNYPNPFNGTTRVTYTLPQSGDVRVSLYDVLGREVRVLEDAHKLSGAHSLTLDADDLPSGSYILRLSQGEFVASSTILLLK